MAAVATLMVVFANELGAFLDPSEASNSTKLAMLQEYAGILSNPVDLIFGRGLGAYEYWEGRGYKFVTELTYLELVRNFGLLGAVVMLGLLLFPNLARLRGESFAREKGGRYRIRVLSRDVFLKSKLVLIDGNPDLERRAGDSFPPQDPSVSAERVVLHRARAWRTACPPEISS